MTWFLYVRCAADRALLHRQHAEVIRIRIEGKKRGAGLLFDRATIRVRSLPASATLAPEPVRAGGGKGGYVCASAWDGYHSVLDGSSYCTGYCTWFVWQRRPEAQLRNLGNADEWYERARARGIPVGRLPVKGAIAWWNSSPHAPEGHVAYVAGVSGGSVTIEEMNRVAWNVTDTRAIPASEPNGYIYGGPAGNGPIPPAGPSGTPPLTGTEVAPELGYVSQYSTGSGKVEVHWDTLQAGGTYKRVGDFVSDFEPSEHPNGFFEVGEL